MSSPAAAARLFFRISRTSRARKPPIFQNKNIAAPLNPVAHKTGGPHKRRHQVTQDQQGRIAKEMSAEEMLVLQHEYCGAKCHCETRDEGCREQSPRPRRPVCCNHRYQRPGQSKSKKESRISPAPRIANRPRPAQLMVKKLPQRVRRKK